MNNKLIFIILFIMVNIINNVFAQEINTNSDSSKIIDSVLSEDSTRANCQDLDDDRDGVNNCIDRCPNSKPGETIMMDGCQIYLCDVDLRGVNFDFDKTTLTIKDIENLNHAINFLKRYPQFFIEIQGHTDSIGSDKYNQKLSEQRASVVYNYFIKHGISYPQLRRKIGYGATRPIQPNILENGEDNPIGRARNRRVEINRSM